MCCAKNLIHEIKAPYKKYSSNVKSEAAWIDDDSWGLENRMVFRIPSNSIQNFKNVAF